MAYVANINGIETIIDIPELERTTVPNVDGDKNSYVIRQGTQVFTGGILSLEFDNTNEMYADIELSMYRLLDFQATAIDVVGAFGESSHIEFLDDNRVRVYATTDKNYTGTFNVKWSAMGVA